jgi:hypothetical protein
MLLEYAIKRGGVTVMSLSFAPGIILLSGGATIDDRENPKTVGPINEPNALEGIGPFAGQTLPPGPTWTLRHDEEERSGGEPTWGGPHAREECQEAADAFNNEFGFATPPPGTSPADFNGKLCVKTNFGSPP